MKEAVVSVRNSVIHTLYTGILKPIFFKNDPEAVHDRMVKIGALLGKVAPFRFITRLFFGYSNPTLKQTVLGMTFENPIGLAAGFDKNAELTGIIPDVGFGFEEVGSITGEKCNGNSKPRLWRLPRSNGLVVHYGLKNNGCEVISEKLKHAAFRNKIGTSVAMTNCEDTLHLPTAVRDFAKAFKAFATVGDYFTLNISCPNTLGGQPFLSPYKLDYLLDIIDEIPTKKPIFIKLSPDLDFANVDEILDVAKKHRVHGIICANLTKKQANHRIVETLPERGAVSGKPVQQLSDNLLAHIYQREKDRFVLVGCGGVFSAEDAYKKIKLGASLVQLVTGMIFEGPQVVSEINQGIAKLLKQDGFHSIEEAVGSAYKQA